MTEHYICTNPQCGKNQNSELIDEEDLGGYYDHSTGGGAIECPSCGGSSIEDAPECGMCNKPDYPRWLTPWNCEATDNPVHLECCKECEEPCEKRVMSVILIEAAIFEQERKVYHARTAAGIRSVEQPYHKAVLSAEKVKLAQLTTERDQLLKEVA